MAGRTFTFLGTGTSVGVPMLGCECRVCTSDNPRNHRYRCAALLRVPGGNILIDTPPELRLQLLRERVKLVHAVVYTHYHADHLFGLDDVRLFPLHLGHAVPVWCSEEVEGVIRTAFRYAFEPATDMMVPQLALRRIDGGPFEVLGETITPVPLEHARFAVYGFRVGDLAYCTDVSRIPEASWPLLEGLDVLVIDALRHKPHPAHFSVGQALDVIERLKPRQAYLTHMTHELDYDDFGPTLPPNVAMAYDGLTIAF
jgi:phosphoribosyl 1,2-cyclic phosphate phosphodiesterase